MYVGRVSEGVTRRGGLSDEDGHEAPQRKLAATTAP